MSAHSRNGDRVDKSTEGEPLEELIREAEELRRHFSEIGGRLSKPVSVLKHHRKQTRAFRQAVDSLKRIDLGG